MANQLEVALADAQAVDTWFEPLPERAPQLERAGLLGRMAPGPTMFEPFYDPPSIDDLRACLRKQLALDHNRLLEAQKQGLPRPPFPKVWVLSTGRPEALLQGYALKAMPHFPEGFYEGSDALSVGVVVLRELPRNQDTLLLRLLGRGAVLKAALSDLAQLPEDAWEKQVAMPELLAMRIEIPQNSNDEGDREYLMSTQNLYEEWERKTREQGREQGRQQCRGQEAKRAFGIVYEARFGSLPVALANAIEAVGDLTTLERWLSVVGTRSQEEIAAAIQAETPLSTS